MQVHRYATASLFLLLGGCEETAFKTTELSSQELAAGVTIKNILNQGNSWQVITTDPAQSPPQIRLSDSTGTPLRNFSAFQKAAKESGETITWMMNAGMYHKGGSPVGLCISAGRELSPINHSDGEGNFFLKPNGIFYLTNKGAQIINSNEWNPALSPTVLCATQSGPLLIRKGILHPAIRPNSPNKLIRNGVGLRSDGQLCFIISTTPVSFHEMALFFRDHLNCPDALYLDGVVSALCIPSLKKNNQGSPLGPIIGLWE